MRRTLWVVTRDLLPAVAGGPDAAIAEIERRRLAKEAGGRRGPGGRGLDRHRIATGRRPCAEHEVSARQLRDALPHLGGTFTAAPGTKWIGRGRDDVAPRHDPHGGRRVVRGHNAGHWRISRPTWTTMASWLGEALVLLDPARPTPARRTVAVDLRTGDRGATWSWWLGSTNAVVRTALADVDGHRRSRSTTGRPGGWRRTTPPTWGTGAVEPWVAPAPDPRPDDDGLAGAGVLPRSGAHRPYLFDSGGNAGTTVWVDGRIVGCWVQDGGWTGAARPARGRRTRRASPDSMSRWPASTRSWAASTSRTCSRHRRCGTSACAERPGHGSSAGNCTAGPMGRPIGLARGLRRYRSGRGA